MADDVMFGGTLSPTKVLEEYLVSKFFAQPLSFSELKSYPDYKTLEMGWRFIVDFPEHPDEEIRVLLRRDFPYSAPILAFSNADRFLVWPHVESDGTLCIFPHSTTIDPKNPVGVIDDLFEEFYSYFLNASTGKLKEDFEAEFLSYWTWGGANETARDVYSIVHPTDTAKEICAFLGRNRIVVADDPDSLIDWNSRCGYGKILEEDILPAIYLKVDSPITPPYPSTAKQFFDLITSQKKTTLPMISKVLTQDWQSLPIIVSSGDGAKSGLICLTFYRPPNTGALGRKTDPVTKGFRRGKVPRKLLISKSFGAGSTVEKSAVVRADHAWVHGRGFDTSASVLATKKVAFVGCGSLGSGLVRLMAQSGLGNMHLFDREFLGWENLSRHQLGARAISKSKAIQVAEIIKADFPHLPSVNATDSNVAMGGQVSIEDLLEFDLIVSTTGSWSGDKFIADLQATVEGFPPVLFSWLEAEALAAHAVLIKSGKASFLAGFDKVGVMNIPVISENDNFATVIPGCSGVFSPYGAIALAHVQAMVAKSCVSALSDQFRKSSHTCFIETPAIITEHNCVINPDWEKRYGKPADSGGVYEFEWSLASSDVKDFEQASSAG